MTLKLLELHQDDQIMIATYRNTSLSFPLSPSELDSQILVCHCEAEEADESLVRQTLNLINGCKNILVCTIETDVLVLVISYISKVELNDIEIHAYVINLDRCYSIKQIIGELDSDFFLLTLLLCFHWSDNVSSFYGKGKSKAYDVWVKSERKDSFTDVELGEVGEKPTNVTSDHIDILVSFVLQLYQSKHDTLGSARLDKFKKSTENDLRLLPLSKDALRQHIYCASYQTRYL